MLRNPLSLASLPVILVAAGLMVGCSAPADGATDDALATSGDELSGTWFALDASPAGSAAEVRVDTKLSTASVTYVDVVVHGFYVQQRVGADGKTYAAVHVPGLPTLGQLGAPALPVFRGELALGSSATAARVVAVSRAGTKTFAGLDVWPQGQDARDDGTAERFVKDPGVYALATSFPAGAGVAGKVARKLDNVRGVTAEAYPVRWNPSTRMLTADAIARFAIQHEGATLAPQTISKQKAASASGKFLNWPVVSRYFPWNALKYEGDFLFVYPAKYREEIAPLVAQKRARGYLTRELTTETIGSSCASVRAAISGWYGSRPASTDKYAILVGDVDAIPTCTAPTGVPTDDLYASTDGDDLDEEVYVGRLSVDTEAELTDQVTKILRYEDGAEAGFDYGKALLVAHGEDAPGKYVGAHESVRTAAYAVTPSFTTQYGSAAGVTDATVSGHVNAGFGLVAYRGHGSSSAWTTWNLGGESFGGADVTALANPARRTPVVWSFACTNSDLAVGDSFAEQWMKTANTRAVAFYGSTVPSYTTPNHELDRRMFKGVFDLGLTTHAKAIEYAEAQMTALYGGDNAWMYLLLGDPEMKVRRRAPLALRLAAPSTFARCSTAGCSLAATVTDAAGKALAGVKVAAFKAGLQSDEVAENRYTDALGKVTIPVAPRTAGTLLLTAEDDAGNVQKASIVVP
jgi:hypothetical protein